MKNIQFSHANGFPASSYKYLFSMLENYQVNYIDSMGHAKESGHVDFYHLRDELIQEIEQSKQKPVIGMGHSAGAAATILAAGKRPELFEHILLLDPVIFSGKKRLFIWLAKQLGLWDAFSPAKKAKRRRVYFKDRDEAHQYFKGKALFKNFHPECFDAYIQYGLKPSDEGLELTFSAAIEADIFRHVPTKAPININKVKGTIVYGDKSDVFSKDDVKWWKKKYPNFELIPFDGGHLFPFEQPEKTSALIKEILSQRAAAEVTFLATAYIFPLQ